MTAAPVPPLTRRQKILQRTRVGVGLAVAVATLLWAASLSIGAWVTLALSVFLTLWSIAEVRRMRLFRHPFAVGAAVAACLVFAYELTRRLGLAEAGGSSSMGTGTMGTGAYFGALAAALCIAALAGAVMMVFGRLARADQRSPGTAFGASFAMSTPVLLAIVAVPLLFLVPVRAIGGARALIALIVLAKVGDIAGYYFGNWLGKSKPFPKISPGKTTEGCLASLIAGTLAGAAFAFFGVLENPRFGVLSGLALGAIVNVSAQAGDLMESVLKRRAAVKDSGTTFGPSGGILDLVDSLLLAAPAAAVAWPFLFHWILPGSV